jgi:hypothetical protein
VADDRRYGEIPGVLPGTAFPNRAALRSTGVHRALQAGIVGNADGAESIIVSGGYDDEDWGDVITYTGHGGRDASGHQVGDQQLEAGNLALFRSQVAGAPVRVVRGASSGSLYAPSAGYRYDGLFRVVDSWQETTASGFLVWRFRLVRVEDAARPLADQVRWTSDGPSDDDVLRRGALASVLAMRLLNFGQREPNLSFLLHVDGRWGSGKTTLLHLLGRYLEDTHILVRFDAWQHAKVDPPWWALLVTLRRATAESLPWWRRWWMRVADGWARVRRGGAPYLLVGLAVAVIVLCVVMFSPQGLFSGAFGAMAKDVGALASALGSAILACLVVSRFAWWDSARGAKRLEVIHTNPMQEVAEHFRWLLDQAPKRVIFMIDNLDRCNDHYTVELLDAVQTLVRDDGSTDSRERRPAYFVVAAHGSWLRRAYETVYKSFAGAVHEPGRSLGHIFLDKLFQLAVPVPSLSSVSKAAYFDSILGVHDNHAVPVEEINDIATRIEESGTESQILEVLRTATKDQWQAAALRAIERMSRPDVTEVTEHALQKFAPLLDSNPRSIKRFVNTYSVVRAARTLEGVTVETDVLAFWTLLAIRWPLLTEHLESQLETLEQDESGAVRLSAVPEQLASLFKDAGLRKVLADAPVALTPDLIRSCCGASDVT